MIDFTAQDDRETSRPVTKLQRGYALGFEALASPSGSAKAVFFVRYAPP